MEESLYGHLTMLKRASATDVSNFRKVGTGGSGLIIALIFGAYSFVLASHKQ